MIALGLIVGAIVGLLIRICVRRAVVREIVQMNEEQTRIKQMRVQMEEDMKNLRERYGVRF